MSHKLRRGVEDLVVTLIDCDDLAEAYARSSCSPGSLITVRLLFGKSTETFGDESPSDES